MNLRLPAAIAAAIVLGGLLSVSTPAAESAEARSCLRAPTAYERYLCEYRAIQAQYNSLLELQRRIQELNRTAARW